MLFTKQTITSTSSSLLLLLSSIILTTLSNGYDLRPGDSTYWCNGCEGEDLANTLITFQQTSGGWPKNQDPQPGDVYSGPDVAGCLDNGATVDEIRFMAQAYQEMDSSVYLQSALDGIDFIFNSQHATGGWPQYYPLRGGYSDAVTYNDNLHVNVMKLLDELSAQTAPFDVAPFADETRTQLAIDKGIECILATQIQVPDSTGGLCPTRTNWCAQHDRDTLEPIPARDYEPASFSGKEGMKLTLYLMDMANPSAQIMDAIVGAYVWAKKSVLVDYAKERDANDNQILVYSENEELWPRFSTIPESHVIFCDRGCVNDPSLMYNDYPLGYSQMDAERRNGYTWLGSWGRDVVNKFENEWSVNNPNHGLNLDCLTATLAPVTSSPTKSPIVTPECPYQECIDRCIYQYGGDGTSGDSYMCSKGCASMSSGQITNPYKFCDVDTAERYDTCVVSCESASSNEDNKGYCRFGCEFWTVTAPSKVPSSSPEAPTAQPTSSPSSSSPSKSPSLAPSNAPSNAPVVIATTTTSTAGTTTQTTTQATTTTTTQAACVDDPNWRYTANNGRKKSCSWVAKKNTSARCTREGDDGRFASEACECICTLFA